MISMVTCCPRGREKPLVGSGMDEMFWEFPPWLPRGGGRQTYPLDAVHGDRCGWFEVCVGINVSWRGFLCIYLLVK